MIFIFIIFVVSAILFIISCRIKLKRKRIIMQIIVLVLCFATTSIGVLKLYKKSAIEYACEINQYKSIYLRGNVIGAFSKGKSALLAIYIDSTNTDYYNKFNRSAALIINNGIAILPIGMIDINNPKDSFKINAKYVIVNRHECGSIDYISNRDTLTTTLTLWPGKLDSRHLYGFYKRIAADMSNGTIDSARTTSDSNVVTKRYLYKNGQTQEM